MPERRRKFTPEFKDEAVKMVIESSRPIAEVAREIHVNEGTLGNWVNRYRADHVDEEPPLTIGEPPTFRTTGLIRSGLEWRIENARTAQEVHP